MRGTARQPISRPTLRFTAADFTRAAIRRVVIRGILALSSHLVGLQATGNINARLIAMSTEVAIHQYLDRVYAPQEIAPNQQAIPMTPRQNVTGLK
jgi:hypothetical protein